IYVGRSETEVREKHGLAPDLHLSQDEDVLDTWFSSALWPFSTLGWPDETPALATFYPTSVLVTGFDIIFFWVARMIMMGLKFTGEVPFHEVYIHGLVRDAQGQKMSKSKGNVLDPLDLIDGIDLETLVEKRTRGLMRPQDADKIARATRQEFPDGIPAFGTDALRFTFASLASTGRDIKFDLNRIQGYRNFCNKIWNAARYVLMNTRDQDTGPSDETIHLGLPERWIRSRLQIITQQTRQSLDSYRFDLAAQAIYEFTWNEYCDWYLELSKPVLTDPAADPTAQRGTRQTLVQVLEQILRLAHPIMPFITEEIWQQLAPLAGSEGETIMLQSYPEHDPHAVDHEAVVEMQWIMTFILGVRKIRSSMNIAPGKPLPVLLQHGSDEDHRRLEESRAYLMTLARLESITWLHEGEEAPESATALVGDMKLLIPMAGLIDKDAEIARLGKEIAKLQQGLAIIDKKLANPNYVEKAPSHVVAKDRQRAGEMRATLEKLQEQLARIEAL
ncbi:MAG: class I tRNA ligase family protein, partial [Gammaproteobacteria bacterium]